MRIFRHQATRRGFHKTVPISVRLRSRVSRRARFLGVVLLVGSAVASVFLKPSIQGSSAEIVVAKRALPAGHRISEADLESIEVLGAWADSVPEASARIDSLTGSRLAVPVDLGQQVTASMTVSAHLIQRLPDGMVAMGLRVRDPDSLKFIGQSAPVHLFVAGNHGEQVKAEGLLILAPENPQNSPLLQNSGSNSGGNLAFFAVDPSTAEQLAGLNSEAVVVARSPEG
ncbi:MULTISPECIES: SAF domain-containing protein [Micrococcaceae]|uniref:SAF domain-containing protein n=1 Tax=unclassified Kocuria TaxID=2649579 RepID=UPI0010125095|nr:MULTISPECIES: SAF domain-containing protein [unclassified Kocuria]